MRVGGIIMALSLVSLGSAPAPAHHSMALFDLNQCLTLSGTVRTFRYQYPHSWLWVFVPNKQGGEDIWTFEAAAPANMVEKDQRWNRDALKKGDKVTLKYAPLKDGRHGGGLSSVSIQGGATLPVPAPLCGDGPPIPKNQR